MNKIAPKKIPKEYVLSLRIRKELSEEIDIVAGKEGMSKSDYIRKAISDAMSFSTLLRLNQTFLVNPEMLTFALKFMDDVDIEEFAARSLQNGQQILKIYLQKNINSSIVQKYLTNNKSIIIGLLTYIIQSVLAPTGQNWFQRIHFAWEGDVVFITGMHGLGVAFSKFMRYYFMHFFKIFEFSEVNSALILKEDRLKVGFRGIIKEFDIKTLMT